MSGEKPRGNWPCACFAPRAFDEADKVMRQMVNIPSGSGAFDRREARAAHRVPRSGRIKGLGHRNGKNSEFS
jgi:hypothetical protein